MEPKKTLPLLIQTRIGLFACLLQAQNPAEAHSYWSPGLGLGPITKLSSKSEKEKWTLNCIRKFNMVPIFVNNPIFQLY